MKFKCHSTDAQAAVYEILKQKHKVLTDIYFKKLGVISLFSWSIHPSTQGLTLISLERLFLKFLCLKI